VRRITICTWHRLSRGCLHERINSRLPTFLFRSV